MSFVLYIIGFLLVIAGVAWALAVAGVAMLYIAIVCLILLGIGVLTGVTKTRPKDPPKGPLA
jgi:amino acid transporter